MDDTATPDRKLVLETLDSNSSSGTGTSTAKFSVSPGQHAWNPDSDTASIDGPAEVMYERSQDGGIHAKVMGQQAQ